jgi:hypothetical protein
MAAWRHTPKDRARVLRGGALSYGRRAWQRNALPGLSCSYGGTHVVGVDRVQRGT